jgi:hypothetical protein
MFGFMANHHSKGHIAPTGIMILAKLWCFKLQSHTKSQKPPQILELRAA